MAEEVKLGKDYTEIWEDSILVALRDMQWAHGEKPLRNELFPDLLFKLNGKAESMAGDVLYALSGQMFLFELKASNSDMGTEPEKHLPKLFYKSEKRHHELRLKEKRDDTEADELDALGIFRSASRACHHMVWAEPKAEAFQNAESCIVQQEMELHTEWYYDIASRFQLEPKTTPNSRQTLLAVTYNGYLNKMGRRVRDGLSAAGMAAYLQILAEHSSTKGDCPMKAVIWSTTGFMWPCYDLTSFPALVEVLQAIPDKFRNGTTKSSVDYFNQMAAAVGRQKFSQLNTTQIIK